VDGQQPTADPAPDREAQPDDPGERDAAGLAEAGEAGSNGAEADAAGDATGHEPDNAAGDATRSEPGDEAIDAGHAGDAPAAGDGAEAGAEEASGGGASGEGAGGERADRPRKPRREKPKRDPFETPFGGMFLDELQRLAGLRGQFAYGVPQKLWRANREQTIRILREEVPMPTYKNQIHCILNSDPQWLAHDVHFEMLSSVTPPEDSFRWLWLYMMLR
jgi:hypothetical protein